MTEHKIPQNVRAYQEAYRELKAINDDLLAALEYYISGEPGPEYVGYRSPATVRKMARAAIAKAKGE